MLYIEFTKKLIVLACLLVFPAVAVANEVALSYPDVGILSEREVDQRKAFSETLVLNESKSIENKDNDFCKLYIAQISMEKLKKVIVFTEDDLTLMTPSKEEKYGSSSLYFDSCNYIRHTSLVAKIIDWNWDEDTLLEWKKTDAYIDTEHSLLLIKYLDKKYDADEDGQMVSALYIHKERQFISNRRMAKGWLLSLIEATTGLRIGGNWGRYE
jgi:hypothetical protein